MRGRTEGSRADWTLRAACKACSIACVARSRSSNTLRSSAAPAWAANACNRCSSWASNSVRLFNTSSTPSTASLSRENTGTARRLWVCNPCSRRSTRSSGIVVDPLNNRHLPVPHDPSDHPAVDRLADFLLLESGGNAGENFATRFVMDEQAGAVAIQGGATFGRDHFEDAVDIRLAGETPRQLDQASRSLQSPAQLFGGIVVKARAQGVHRSASAEETRGWKRGGGDRVETGKQVYHIATLGKFDSPERKSPFEIRGAVRGGHGGYPVTTA